MPSVIDFPLFKNIEKKSIFFLKFFKSLLLPPQGIKQFIFSHFFQYEQRQRTKTTCRNGNVEPGSEWIIIYSQGYVTVSRFQCSQR